MVIIKVGGPRIAAYLSFLSIDWGGMEHDRTILCLGRDSFAKDIAELRKGTALNYPMVTGGFTRFQLAWFPSPMQVQTFYRTHVSDSNAAIKKSTEYASYLVRLVNRRKPVHAVLSANFDYWQDAGFKKLCKDLDIPFLVLSREHPVIPKVCNWVVERYKQSHYQFEGAAIAVAGRSTRDVILRAETICAPEQVKITGLPRYDSWRSVDVSLPVEERPLITLLTFAKGYYADETFKDVLQLFWKAARHYARTKVRFLVKTKDASDTQHVRNMMATYGLDGLECGHELNLFDVLPRSRMVINYNSLSLLEAVMARAWTVVPAWGQCKDRGDETMYPASNPKVAKVVSFAENPEKLSDMIASSIKGYSRPTREEEVLDFIGEYIHLPHHGSYCREFESFVTSYLRH